MTNSLIVEDYQIIWPYISSSFWPYFSLLSATLFLDPYEVHHHLDNKNNIDEDIDDEDDSEDENNEDVKKVHLS